MDPKLETYPIHSEPDLLSIRRAIRAVAKVGGFGALDLTRSLTIASELVRNVLRYGTEGTLSLELLDREGRQGLRVIAQDRGVGIADLERALQDGYSTSGGLGLGLGGVRRLASAFELQSEVGVGTTVRATLWRSR